MGVVEPPNASYLDPRLMANYEIVELIATLLRVSLPLTNLQFSVKSVGTDAFINPKIEENLGYFFVSNF